jgi:hypothetical protein
MHYQFENGEEKMVETTLLLVTLYLIGSAIAAGVVAGYIPRGHPARQKIILWSILASWYEVGRAIAALLRSLEMVSRLATTRREESRIVKPN